MAETAVVCTPTYRDRLWYSVLVVPAVPPGAATFDRSLDVDSRRHQARETGQKALSKQQGWDVGLVKIATQFQNGFDFDWTRSPIDALSFISPVIQYLLHALEAQSGSHLRQTCESLSG